MVILRARQRGARSSVHWFETAPGPCGVRRADRVGVEAGADCQLTAATPAVAEMDRDAAVGMANDRKDGPLHGWSAIAKLDEVYVDLSMFAAPIRRGAPRPEFRRGRRTHEDGVVPRQFRDWFRQFLQPAVVREASIENRGIVAKRDLEAGNPAGTRSGVHGGSRIPGSRGLRDRV